jgi:formate dehydrogenase major subunit
MDSIRLKINGQEVEATAGQTILEVVREHALDEIPTLCASPELEPYGSCFVCVVEVKGRPMLVPACATRVAPNMEVTTRNERILASRKTAFELLISNHYADCVSPCLLGCPANVDAQGYLALAAMGQYEAAVDLIRENNPLPAVCGRVCVRKCEVACRRADIDAPVAINNVKRFVTDWPGIYDKDPVREPSTGRTVGIVGAGPAGLAAAWFLGRKGHDVTLYESMPKAGGMIRYGIPVYRLPDDVIDREVDYIERAGARIVYDCTVGRDVSLSELRKRHHALFLAAGAWEGKGMQVEGEYSTEGVVNGINFLREKYEDPKPLSGTVAVVGGGNTAMDVARTSWRLGAEKVLILYRRTKAEMPADKMEIEDALHEGIEIMELCAPVGIVADGAGALKALRCIRMKLGEPDRSGRRRPIPMEGSEFDVPCNLAVSAIGQGLDPAGLTGLDEEEAIHLTKWTTIQVDSNTLSTNVPGVFAGGDAADDGPTVVIDAISDGRRAARSIHAFMSGQPIEKDPFVVRKAFWAKPGKAELGEIPESPRHEVHLIPVEERRLSFKEVATGFELEDVCHEGARCLSCGCVRFDDCALRRYAQEYDVDMNRFAGYVRKHKVDERHPYIVYDPNKCILCARCVRTCAQVLPIAAIGLVGRGFRAEVRPAMNDPLVETNCISCGNCVDACPTAALTVKYPFPGRAALTTSDVSTHCAFCSIGCELKVKRFGKGRYYVTSSGKPGDYLCRYGRFGYEIFVRQDRIVSPRVRVGPSSQEVPFSDALHRVADGLRKVRDKYGPESVGVFVSPDASNEVMYLAGRLAREGLGTRNVASLAVLSLGQEQGPLDGAFGFTGSTAGREVLKAADVVVCNNTSLESDHLILAVELEKALRKGAKLIVANSTLDMADRVLATVAMDPIRGRAAQVWSGITRLLVRGTEGLKPVVLEAELARLPGGPDLLADMDRAGFNLSEHTGISEATLVLAARHLGSAKRVVILHSPDRAQDASAGDAQALANLLFVLRACGISAELLLPRMFSNGAGLEAMGANPVAGPGRAPVSGLPGATSLGELRDLLHNGKIRGALVIHEDPMRSDRVAGWFRNVEFLAAMDWTDTETTASADVVLPGTTFLEAGGTRCNFEGSVIAFTAVQDAPGGLTGREVLSGLCAQLDVTVTAESSADLLVEIDAALRAGLGDLSVFIWNRGEERPALMPRAVPVAADFKAVSIPAPITHGELYKREIREVGTGRYRVQK